jgi:hypothetical protein
LESRLEAVFGFVVFAAGIKKNAEAKLDVWIHLTFGMQLSSNRNKGIGR